MNRSNTSVLVDKTILNQVLEEKLPNVLMHVLEKCHDKYRDAFTIEEKEKLTEILHFSIDQINQMVLAIKEIFLNAAYHGQLQKELLLKEGLTDSVATHVFEVWQKGNATLLEKMKSSRIGTPFTLHDTNWRLHLQMGHRKLTGQTDPTAIIEMILRDPNQQEEKLDLEMNHEELYAFLLKLNTIQGQLDQIHGATPTNP